MSSYFTQRNVLGIIFKRKLHNVRKGGFKVSEKGWIRIYRQIRDHWLYTEKRTFSKFEAWFDLLLSANYADRKDGGALIKRGSLKTSENALMERWGWSKKKLRGFLQRLQDDGMIRVESQRTGKERGTVITILNYDQYQTPEATVREGLKRDHKSTRNDAGFGDVGDHKETTEYTDDFNRFWDKYPLQVDKEQSFAAWLDTLKGEDVKPDDLITAAEAFAEECEKKNTKRKYIVRPWNFLRKGIYRMYIDEGVGISYEPETTYSKEQEDFEHRILRELQNGGDINAILGLKQ